MKRTNVILDEDLLEKARQVTGEKTYSGAINKALEEYVRVETVKRGVEGLRAMNGAGLFPGYLKRVRPNVIHTPRSVAANEVRAPRKKSSRRGAR
jgi:hypothetical protein